MTDKKRKTINSFQNRRRENKLSKIVESIERWVIDVLKHQTEND